jgi:FtsH-binding integral membrane protein
MGWLLLGYFVAASLMMIRSEVEPGEADNVLRLALIVTSIVGFLFGLAAVHLKKQLFWVRRKVTIEDGGGRAVFLGFSMAGLTGGGLSSLAMFAPRLLWGEIQMPVAGVGIGLVFLVLLFPRLPQSTDSEA